MQSSAHVPPTVRSEWGEALLKGQARKTPGGWVFRLLSGGSYCALGLPTVPLAVTRTLQCVAAASQGDRQYHMGPYSYRNGSGEAPPYERICL